MRSRTSPRSVRRDGWTVDRQLRFLDALAATRSVTEAAHAAGMSRESAHRLRDRSHHALFAALWDLAVSPSRCIESHTAHLSDGRLMRLLGTQYRRESGDFVAIGRSPAKAPWR